MNTLLHVALSNCVVALALAVAAACVGRWCRRPALTHGLWLLVLLKLVTPPLVFVPLAWPAAPTPEIAAAPTLAIVPPQPADAVEQPAVAEAIPPEDAPEEWDDLPVVADALPLPAEPVPLQEPPAVAVVAPADGVPWLLLAGTLWLAGSACWFAVAIGRIRRFHGLLHHAAPAPAEVQDEAARLATRLGLARCPRVWLVQGVVSPMLWAVGGTPRLLLPSGLLERVSSEQRATLLAHELAHLRRRDHLVRFLELLVLGLYWWFPLVWWARRELREAEEECCDAWVVWALPESPRAYATALVETLDFLSEARPILPPAASGVGHLHLLRRRLTMIMRGTTPRALTGAGLLGVLGLGLLLLPLVPSWAQEPPGPGKPADPLEKVRAELRKREAALEKMMLEVEQWRHEMKRLQTEHDLLQQQRERQLIEKQREELERARKGQLIEQQHEQFERARKAQAAKLAAGAGKPGGGPMGLEQRLAVLEHKLDMVLHELHELRREAAKRRTPPGMGPGLKVPNPPPVPGGPGVRPGGGTGGPGKFPGAPGLPGAAPKPAGLPGDPNLPAAEPPTTNNPPQEQVHGRVLKINSADRTLVTVSVGHEAGVHPNNTLEVYRLRPQPEYLGRLLIQEATPHQAVGRLLPASGKRSQLKEGDEVSSTIPR